MGRTIYFKGNSLMSQGLADGATYNAEYWTEVSPPDNTGKYVFQQGEWHVWGSIVKPVRYSKLKIVRSLKAAGVWTDVKTALESSDAMDEWNAAAWLADTDPLFVSMKTTFTQAYPNIDINELLANCLY